MQETIVNRVAESGIVTINLEDFYPKDEILVFDLKDHLFRGLLLKEKEFRAALITIDWSVYQQKNVAITCTSDAIIPVWAYMLVATYLGPFANNIMVGTPGLLAENILLQNISQVDTTTFTDKRIVIKGCGDIHIPESAYAAITFRLKPVAKSIMYGEPCSTVPVYKKK
ncbi:DUF2480 family protein [Panacibacter sp. DH6]|uniref:DUF2480 family protein n=1 Tax=Panacibacter microcysteis TaxID=2793269 RepID=A0A931GTN8_9BACT|nr:DUF2480 family protein [Panacibacter microcysteis]MBG9375761.1 DUF2480 family protein [Panacibacter microcysteis]